LRAIPNLFKKVKKQQSEKEYYDTIESISNLFKKVKKLPKSDITAMKKNTSRNRFKYSKR